MSRYLVSARKYRPQTFGEVVGQEHVAETLRNALRLDRLAHAYLFSGPRGVGKTTAARILAKAINCETPLADRPDAEPCRTCASCRDFEEGRSLNIIEIDAASNNKVDDIRELRDTVRVPPQGARRKVYIVDEVHMLSTSAFNALLKTLEEPPPYVLFIFATTEPHKVLPTILSRCQRFDFRRIALDDAVEHLRHICAEEGFTADDASLMLIAKKGDGALRDTLSAFDQAVALIGQDLRYDALAEALGVVGVDLFFETTDAVQQRSGAALLALVDRIVRRGHDLTEYLVGLQEHLRNLLVARTLPDARLVEADDTTRARYRDAAQAFSEPDLLRLLALVAEAEEALKIAAQPRLRLELTLLKAVALASVRDLNAAMNAVARLEKMARDGTIPTLPTVPEPPAAMPSSVSNRTMADERTPVETPHGGDSTTTNAEPPTPKSAPSPPPPVSRRDDRADDTPPEPPTAPPRQPIPPAPTSAPARPDEPELSLGSLFTGPTIKRRADRNRPAPQDLSARAAEPTSDYAAAPETPVAPSNALGAIGAAWSFAVQSLGSPRLTAALADAVPEALDGSGALTVRLDNVLAADALRDAADALIVRLRETAPVRTVRPRVEAAATSGDGRSTAEPSDPYALVRRLRDENAVAAALLDALGGEVA